MGDAIRLSFGLGSDPGRYGPDAGPQHWNAHVETVEDGKHPTPIRCDDGLTVVAALTAGGKCRGMIEMGGALYVVSGQGIYKVTSTWTVTQIGTLAGTDIVEMSKNAAATPQIVIVANGDKYKIESDTVSQITDTDLPASVSCTFLNARIIYGIANGAFYWSAVDDADDIDPLDTATAEGDPDSLVAVRNHLQEIWVFGSKTAEIWVDTGNATAPFRRQGAGVIPKGCIGRNTIAQLDNNLFWVGQDGIVYGAQGYGFERISHFGVEESIRETSDKSTIEAMSYIYGGHAWYILSGPDWTWAFNRTTGKWHQKFSYGNDRWRGSQAVEFNNQIIIGDYERAVLYKIDRDAFTEGDDNIIWRLRTAPVHAFPNQISIDRLYLDLVTGVGLNSSDEHSNNPLVGLRWSDDGGRSWSNQLLRTLGRIGEYNTRVAFEALGITGRTGRIFEVEVSAPVVRSLMYAAIEGDEIGT